VFRRIALLPEKTRSLESVAPANVGPAATFTLWSNQSFRVGVPLTVNRLPLTVRFEAKRLVLDAVVAKKFVVVALVPVALAKVKSVNVDDAVDRKPFRKPRVVDVALPHD
jgi:hypothetical protein